MKTQKIQSNNQTFGTVVKKTLVVIFVTVLFTVVLFGMDYLLGLLYKLVMKS